MSEYLIKKLGLRVFENDNGIRGVDTTDLEELLQNATVVYGRKSDETWVLTEKLNPLTDTHKFLIFSIEPLEAKKVTVTKVYLEEAFFGHSIADIEYIAKKLGLR